MYTVMERYMVQRLRQSGLPQGEIRTLTGISERTIRRIEQEPPMSEADDASFRKSRKLGRKSGVEPYTEQIQQWLSEERAPGDGPMKSTEIFARLRGLGYPGGRSAVYELVRRLRPIKAAVPVVRFEGLPGEFSQHDFGQRQVVYADGTSERVHFFASRLKYSRFISVQVVENEQQETVIRCLLRDFQQFGGMPLMCVFDNMKSVVNSRSVTEEGRLKVEWQQPFAQFAMDCGFVPLACWPYRPQQKGSVENLVGFVKGNFFCGRIFKDRADLISQLQQWETQVNQERPCDATGEIPALRLRQESLKACEHHPDTYAMKVSAIVRPTARVHYQSKEYSVPAAAIGQTVTLQLQREQVAIYLGNQRLAIHPRFPENGKSSVLSDHAQELFRFQRGKPYAQRQLLLELDPPLVEPYLTELVHRRPQSWEPDIDQMYALYEQVGRSDLLAAIALATEQRCFGGEYLQEIVHSQGDVPPGRERP
jgi:transposase